MNRKLSKVNFTFFKNWNWTNLTQSKCFFNQEIIIFMRISVNCCQHLGVFDHYHHLNMPSFIGENHFNPHLFHLGSHRCPKRAKSGLEIRGSSAKTDKYPNGIQSILSRGTKSCQDLIQYTFNPQPPDYCPCPPNWNWCRCLSSLVDCALQLNFTQDIGHLQSTFGGG